MRLGAHSAVTCIQCTNFIIKQCIFKNLVLSSAIFTEDLKKGEKPYSFSVTESRFENIESLTNGAALKIANSDLEVESNAFINCRVESE